MTLPDAAYRYAHEERAEGAEPDDQGRGDHAVTARLCFSHSRTTVATASPADPMAR